MPQIATLNPYELRKDFPILSTKVKGKPLVYLDNAASTQKPLQVMDAVRDHYSMNNSNIHRGVHSLSQAATDVYEQAREKCRSFLNAKSTKEIVFVRNATEGINLVVSTFGRKNIQKGDEVVVTEMEHHANIVPWQILCEEKGAILKVIPFNDAGELDISDLDNIITAKTKMVSVVYVSNSLGTQNPVEEIITKAHSLNIPVMLDGAQAAPHMKLDVQKLDCEFFVFSGHKIYAPSGTGVLFGKAEYLEDMPPYQGGGDMIKEVTFAKTTYNDIPFRFEAGTPNIEGAVGLAAAIDYLEKIGMDNIAAYEEELLQYATQEMSKIEGIRLIGTSKNKAAVVSFLIDDIHPQDIGILLDEQGIAIRTGNHCTQPVMQHYGVPGTCRASFSFYNTKEEVDVLVEAIKKVKTIFG